MRDLATLRELYQHQEWADALVWQATLKIAAAVEDRVLRERLYHIHMVQYAFLLHWQKLNEGIEPPNFPDALSLARWGNRYHQTARRFWQEVDEAALMESSIVPWTAMAEKRFGQKVAPTTFGETALQVVMHSGYHRGQVNSRLRELRCEPPLTDFIAWVWLGKPESDWPLQLQG